MHDKVLQSDDAYNKLRGFFTDEGYCTVIGEINCEPVVIQYVMKNKVEEVKKAIDNGVHPEAGPSDELKQFILTILAVQALELNFQ